MCGGPEGTGCLFQGPGCSTQPARRKRKEGRWRGDREKMFLKLRKGCLERKEPQSSAIPDPLLQLATPQLSGLGSCVHLSGPLPR